MNRKKVCILCANNIKHMTLVSLYTDILEKNHCQYDIIYIDMYHKEEKSNANRLYRFELDINPDWSVPKKLLHYWKFRKFALPIIESNEYDFVIIWNELTTFMFSDYMSKKMKGKYCINIRDYNFNNIPIVQYRLKKAVSASAFSTISSERFKTFLPKYDYLFIHSYNHSVMNGLVKRCGLRDCNQQLRIMFIGRMSYPENLRRMILALGNDPRFVFYLVGTGCGEFEQMVTDNGFENVIIHDSFEPNETGEYLKNADIIYSLNKENEIFSDVLLPIKLYYSVHMCIPIIAFKSSYTYEFAAKHNFAIGITENEIPSAGDIIYEQYYSLNQEQIEQGCEEVMQEVKDSHIALNKKIDEFILKEE